MTTCRSASSIFLGVVLGTALVVVAGCHSPGSDWRFSDLFDLDKGLPWAHDDGPQQGLPSRVVGTWTDTVLRKEGQTPQRGFGGRLLFYGRDSNDPILVDGQLVVYAFDETGRDPTDNRPTRRYVFPPDQLPLHMSESELGASYSFWLPWDEVGGSQTEVSLMCRFEPRGGSLVVGEQTRHLLPGTLNPGTMLAANRPPKLPEGVPSRPAMPQASYSAKDPSLHLAQAASYESPTIAAPTDAALGGGEPATQALPNRQMTTTSISLPESFRLHTGVASVRAGSSASRAEPNGEAAGQSPGPARGAPAQSSQTSGATPAVAAGWSAWPFSNPPPQAPAGSAATWPMTSQSAAAPAGISLPAADGQPATTVPPWTEQQQMLAGGLGATATHTTGAQQPAPRSGLTTTVSYRFPGQPAPSPYPGQASFGLPPQTPPAQATPAFPASTALSR